MSIELNKIYCENCLDTMARMPDNFVDYSITSPPYNINLRIRGGKYAKRSLSEKLLCNKYSDFSDDFLPDEYYGFHLNVINELLRVTKKYLFWNVQLLTGNKLAVFNLIGTLSKHIKEVIIWDKCNSEPAMLDGVLNSQFEIIIVFSHDEHEAMRRQFIAPSFNRGELSNVLNVKKVSGNKNAKKHGATFPYYLPGLLIKYFTKKDEIIYDPFIGTGTTAISCINLKRQWIGSEISDKNCDLANNRIEPYMNQLALF